MAPPGGRVRDRSWLDAAGRRAIRTAAQSAGGAIGATAALTIQGVRWDIVAGTAALAALLSALTSLAGLPEHGPDEPAEPAEPAGPGA